MAELVYISDSESNESPEPYHREETVKMASLVRIGGGGEYCQLRISNTDTFTVTQTLWNLPLGTQPTQIIQMKSPLIGSPVCRFFRNKKFDPLRNGEGDNSHSIQALPNPTGRGVWVNGRVLSTSSPCLLLRHGDLLSFGADYTEEQASSSCLRLGGQSWIHVYKYIIDGNWKGSQNADLPEDIISKICSYLPVPDIKCCRLVNHLWKRGSTHELKRKSFVLLQIQPSLFGLELIKSQVVARRGAGLTSRRIHVVLTESKMGYSEMVVGKILRYLQSLPWNIHELKLSTRLHTKFEREFLIGLLITMGPGLITLALDIRVCGKLVWDEETRPNLGTVQGFNVALRTPSLGQETSLQGFGRWLMSLMPNLLQVNYPCDIALPFFRGATASQPLSLQTMNIGPRSSFEGLENEWTSPTNKLLLLGRLSNPPRLTRLSLFLPDANNTRGFQKAIESVRSCLEELHIKITHYRSHIAHQNCGDCSHHILLIPNMPKLKELKVVGVFPIPTLMGQLNYQRDLPVIQRVILEAEFDYGFAKRSTVEQFESLTKSLFPGRTVCSTSMKMLLLPKLDLLNKMPTLSHRSWTYSELKGAYSRLPVQFPNAEIIFSEPKLFGGVSHYHSFD